MKKRYERKVFWDGLNCKYVRVEQLKMNKLYYVFFHDDRSEIS